MNMSNETRIEKRSGKLSHTGTTLTALAIAGMLAATPFLRDDAAPVATWQPLIPQAVESSSTDGDETRSLEAFESTESAHGLSDFVGPPSGAVSPAVTVEPDRDSEPQANTRNTAADPEQGEAPTAAQVAAAKAKMSGPVAALAAQGGNTPAEIIVSYADHPQLFEADRVESLGGEVVRRYTSFDMMAVRLPASSLVELAIGDSVDRLSLDAQIASLSVEKVSANLPAAGSANAVYQGSSVGVAILDSGLSKHSDLGDNVLQYSFLNGNFPQPVINNGVVETANDGQRKDQYGHGTHVAGILSGDGSDSNQEFTGTAQGATLLALQVLDNHGKGSSSDVIAALDWLQQYGQYFDIRVANLSLGQGVTESIDTDPMVAAVEALWDQGVVVIVAAGNYGRHGNGTVMSPGNSRKVITVGSLTDNGTGADTSDDYVSTFSSRGPTFGDMVLKPDLVAPGNRLVAAIPKNAKLRDDLPGRVVACSSQQCADDYFELSGTSMAAPMVSAAVALMLEKDPSLTPADEQPPWEALR